jgi:RNA polymerase sigma-70 factor (ECF subfamily)
VSHSTQDLLVQWFREWRNPVRRFLASRRAVPRADIDDVAQEVFLRMLRYDCSQLVTNPQPYIFKMAANVAADWSTRAHRRQPHASSWLDDLAAQSRPESELQDMADEAILLSALEALPVRSREVLRLHFDEGLTHEEIGKRLRLSRRVIKRETIRAYALLRDALRAADFEPPNSGVVDREK